MAEYITKDEAYNAVDERIKELKADKEFNIVKEICISGVRKHIATIKPADVAPVIHGSWIDLSNGECDDFGRPYVYVKCSECGETAIKYSDYCPNCGAKMED